MTTSDLDDGLKLEYSACQDGYNSRDRIVPGQAFYLLALFSALTALGPLLGSALHNSAMRIAVSAVLFLPGSLWLWAMHVDMASNMSCKAALRERMREIEGYWSGPAIHAGGTGNRMWTETIENRRKFPEEVSFMTYLTLMLREIPVSTFGFILRRVFRRVKPSSCNAPVWMFEDLYIWVGRLALPTWAVVFWLVVLSK